MKKLSQAKKSLHVKVGDRIRVISGQEKGKFGTIKKIYPRESKIIVEGINIKVKHIKASRAGGSGQIQRLEFPIHSSNVLKEKEEIEWQVNV